MDWVKGELNSRPQLEVGEVRFPPPGVDACCPWLYCKGIGKLKALARGDGLGFGAEKSPVNPREPLALPFPVTGVGCTRLLLLPPPLLIMIGQGAGE